MNSQLTLYLVLIPALPLAAAVLTALFGSRFLRGRSHLLVIAAFAGSCICSLLLLAEVSRRQQTAESAGFEHVVNLWTWANVSDAYDAGNRSSDALAGGVTRGTQSFRIDIALRADALTAVMLAMVTFVSTLVAIFAAGYMRGDRAYWRFFAYIALFVFSMTMLVSVSNFVLLYVFWEAVGVCSYLLIGFWYEKPEAAAAGKKAFLVNRVGDFGFALALFLIWTTYGSLNFHDTVAGGTDVARISSRSGLGQDSPDTIGRRQATPDIDLAVGVFSLSGEDATLPCSCQPSPQRGKTYQPRAERSGASRKRRPGSRSNPVVALKGRNNEVHADSCCAPSGLCGSSNTYPGRWHARKLAVPCPGLICSAPSGRKSDGTPVRSGQDATLPYTGTTHQIDTDQVSVERGVLGATRIAANDYHGGMIALAICLLLLLGACGKSAQLPLHVWLPDAMEGPTPVSALIHAATMVTAGVYMIARCAPLFMASPEAQLVVACVGAATALLAGLIALTQFDLKRVLAYSTISQLGYMFLGLGTGTFAGITAGMFHLFTHAFFKALLFLGAGSVMHAMGNVIDMRRFGGLRKVLPITHATFFVGCLALAGVPGLSGFWSKDAIVAAVHDKVHSLQHAGTGGHSHTATDVDLARSIQPAGSTEMTFVALQNGAHETQAAAGGSVTRAERYATIYQWLYWSAMFTAFLTVFYTFRAFYLTFYGAEQIPAEAAGHAHESPPIMFWPLIVLAAFAALVGFVLDQTWQHQGTNRFVEFLGQTPSLAGGAVAATKTSAEFHLVVAGTSGAISLGGWLLATYLYLGSHREIGWVKALLDFDVPARLPAGGWVSRFGQLPWVSGVHRAAGTVGMAWLTSALGGAFKLVVMVISAPVLLRHLISPYKLSRGKFFIDELYQVLVVLPMRGVAALCYAVDRWLVDGVVNAIGRIPPNIGSLMRSLQMGLVQFYALAMLLGMLILIAARIMAAG